MGEFSIQQVLVEPEYGEANCHKQMQTDISSLNQYEHHNSGVVVVGHSTAF